VKVIMLFPFGFKLDEIPVTLEIEKLMSWGVAETGTKPRVVLTFGVYPSPATGVVDRSHTILVEEDEVWVQIAFP
jgi:hypothetical protein